MKLLDFVALYGLILMPMGTVIFLDYWVLPKLNLKSFYAETAGIAVNWAAGVAWILTLCFCLALYLLAGIENFFLFIPGWFIAAVLYIAGSMLVQKRAYREIGQ
jgi:cytosine/uracil/thiamine/allantoin permease